MDHEGRLGAPATRPGRIGGVRTLSPPTHDTMAQEETTPARVQPPQQAKTKDADFCYTA